MSVLSPAGNRNATASGLGLTGVFIFGVGLYLLVRAWSPATAGPLPWPAGAGLMLTGILIATICVTYGGGAIVIVVWWIVAVAGSVAPHPGWNILPSTLGWGLVAAIGFAMLALQEEYLALKEDLRPGLYAHGCLAVATILDLEYQSTKFGSDPVIRVTVRMTPVDGADTVDGRRDVFGSTLRSVGVRQRLPALFSPLSPDRFLLVVHDDPEAPPAVRELCERLRAEPPAARPDAPALLPVLARLGELVELKRANPDAPWEEYGRELNDLNNKWFP